MDNRYYIPGSRENWHVVIGIETHVQLLTRSKAFSNTATIFGAEPNSQVNWLDCALPGTLPVANQAAINHAIRLGLAINAKINQHSIFARKHYFYPDLPKGYQISQYEEPIIEFGKLIIEVDDYQKTVEILRAHMEEDAGKLVHDLYANKSAIDLNRAGTPLIEIVTEPCLYSTQEAITYARSLHNLVKWIGICDGNMQEGSFRCDANVSVKKVNSNQLGIRCEIKNLNSFKFLEEAINYEINRQIEALENGEIVNQETRLFNPDTGETRSMRNKEDAHDYRYFPDPDLLTVVISDDEINKIKHSMPELPSNKKTRYVYEYQLSQKDAEQLLASFEKASVYDQLIELVKDIDSSQKFEVPSIAKICANWLLGVVSAQINICKANFNQLTKANINLNHLAELIVFILEGKINSNSAKTVFSKMLEDVNKKPLDIVTELGLSSIENIDELNKLIEYAIDSHPKAVEEYKKGKEKALMSLVGKVMKSSAGRADAVKVKEILKKRLK